jgi:hypothetical protein
VVNKNTLNNQTVSFEIMDIHGRLAMNGVLNTLGVQTSLQVAELEAGIYFIRFKTGNQNMVSLKFIKI